MNYSPSSKTDVSFILCTVMIFSRMNFGVPCLIGSFHFSSVYVSKGPYYSNILVSQLDLVVSFCFLLVSSK